jgi:tetraacyldisaccharide 4'-kinase
VVGGSGKTPITITLANYLKDKYKIGIVLRGVNREGKGIEKVSGRDPERFGEEAVELFLETGVPVVVGKDRLKGIEILKKEGIEVILMDDGFHKPIEKFEIVIDKKLPVPLCLPAGGYRLPRFLLKRADLILEEGINFWRRVTPIEGDILVTAISDPSRLLKWVNVKETLFFPDHHHFKWEELAHLQNKVIVTTRKDFVKLRRFPLTLKVIPLSIELAPDVLKKVEEYLINSSPTS